MSHGIALQKGPQTVPRIRSDKLRVAISPYLISTVMVGLATGFSYFIESTILPSNLSLVYLPAVLFSAMQFGLWPSILAATLSVLSWDFLFLPPKYKLRIDDPQDLLTMILFLTVALVVSNLVALTLRQKEVIADRVKATEQLYDFSQRIGAVQSLEELLSVVARTIGQMMSCEVMLLLPNSGALQIRSGYPLARQLDSIEMEQAQATWSSGLQSQAGELLFFPLRTQGSVIGVLALSRESSPELLPDEQRLLSTFKYQAAVAIERAQLAQSIGQARLEAETERLRNAMLTSVSHDLRTPLTVIIGALSTIKSLGETCDPVTRAELLDGTHEEAKRLDRFIDNLLNMTKIESGQLNLKLEPIDLLETIETALERASGLTVHHKVTLDLPPELPMPTADFMLVEQVIFNLIDNAAKYSPAETEISVSARADGSAVVIEVADEGDGLSPLALKNIFNKFARFRREDMQRPGTGLGLAICRGFLDAMGGAITASNRKDRSGALFSVRLSLA